MTYSLETSWTPDQTRDLLIQNLHMTPREAATLVNQAAEHGTSDTLNCAHVKLCGVDGHGTWRYAIREQHTDTCPHNPESFHAEIVDDLTEVVSRARRAGVGAEELRADFEGILSILP